MCIISSLALSFTLLWQGSSLPPCRRRAVQQEAGTENGLLSALVDPSVASASAQQEAPAEDLRAPCQATCEFSVHVAVCPLKSVARVGCRSDLLMPQRATFSAGSLLSTWSRDVKQPAGERANIWPAYGDVFHRGSVAADATQVRERPTSWGRFSGFTSRE